MSRTLCATSVATELQATARLNCCEGVWAFAWGRPGYSDCSAEHPQRRGSDRWAVEEFYESGQCRAWHIPNRDSRAGAKNLTHFAEDAQIDLGTPLRSIHKRTALDVLFDEPSADGEIAVDFLDATSILIAGC